LNKGASKEEAHSIEHLCKHRTKTCAAHQFFKCRGLLGITEQGRVGWGVRWGRAAGKGVVLQGVSGHGQIS